MKLLRKLAILATALTLCLGASALFTACGGGNNSSSSSSVSSVAVSSSASSVAASSSEESAATAYKFVVLNSDGTPAKDINVQLCTAGATMCFMPMLTDADGVVKYAPMGFPGEGEYEIHLFTADMTTPLEFNGSATTPATFNTITLTLK